MKNSQNLKGRKERLTIIKDVPTKQAQIYYFKLYIAGEEMLL